MGADTKLDLGVEPPARRERGVAARVRRAVLAAAGVDAPDARLIRHSSQAWASVTFSGTRHLLAIEFTGGAGVAAGERLVAELAEHEFAIPGQLVADAAVTEVSQGMFPAPWLTVAAELLLLEEV